MLQLLSVLLLAVPDAATATPNQPRTLTSPGAIRALGFSPGGHELVSGESDGLRVWNLQAGTSRWLRGPRGVVRDVVVLGDGRIFTGSDGGAYVLGPADGTRRTLMAKEVCSVDTSRDGKTAVLVAMDGFHVFSLPGFEKIRTIADDAQLANCRSAAVSWDGKHVAGLSHRPDFQVRVWESASGRKVAVAGLERERNPGTLAAFAPDRSLLAVTAGDTEIRLVDYLAGTLVAKLVAHRKSVTALAFSPEGRTLAAASEDGIRLWDLATKTTRTKLMPGDYVVGLAFSPDGKTLAAALLSSGTIKLWPVEGSAGPGPTHAASAPKPAGGETAYMVIVDGSPDLTEAEAKLVAYDKQGFPRYGDYPKLVESASVEGLSPGYWVVVAAVARDKTVARRLNAFIGALGGKPYVRKVQVGKPDDLRLLAIGGGKLRCERKGKRTITGRIRGFHLLQEEECHGECEGQGGVPFITARASKNGGVVLPYTADQVPRTGVLHIGCEHEPADFGEASVACTLPGLQGNATASFDANKEAVTEIDAVTAECFDYDELNDWLQGRGSGE